MPRYKLTLEYDGTPFAGWQKAIGLPSVQQALEDAARAFCGEETAIVGSGRTDAGVHAAAQVAHVDFSKAHDAFTVMNALNFHLLDSAGGNIPTSRGSIRRRAVSVIAAEQVADDFHARFDASARYYRYRILNRRAPSALDSQRVWHVPDPLDAAAMQAAADTLVGYHDFSSFRDSQCQAKSPLKTLDALRVTRDGDEIRIEANARSFLHHQIRIITGTLHAVGAGKWPVAQMKSALEAKDRTKAGPTAPPQGLYLMKVEF